jgi:uncharacterized protein YbjQ (UPF0145 family)
MAKFCTKCNKKLPFGGGIVIAKEELCDECYELNSDEIYRENALKREQEAKFLTELKDKIPVLSLHSIENKKIIKYYDMISKEIFIGTGFLSELSTSFDDILGITSGAFSDKIDKAKDQAFDSIKLKAFRLGANAIVGARVDYMINKNNMLMYSISGTPVVIEELL